MSLFDASDSGEIFSQRPFHTDLLGDRSTTTRPVISDPVPPPPKIIIPKNFFGGGGVIGGDNRPYTPPSYETDKTKKAKIIIGDDFLTHGQNVSVGEGETFKGVIIPQWGSFQQQKHDRLMFLDRENMEYGLNRYYNAINQFKPENYSHLELLSNSEIQQLAGLVDRYSANLAEKLTNILQGIVDKQAELERLISLNPDVTHGRSVEDNIDEIGKKIGDIISTVTEQQVRQQLMDKIKSKLGERLGRFISTRVQNRIRNRLTGLGRRGYQRLEQAGISGERVLGTFERINEALTILSVETEVIRDLSDIAILATHGERDSVTEDKMRDMMGVNWYRDNVDDKSEILGLLGRFLGFGIYEDLVQSTSNIYELMGGSGVEFDSERFKRLTDTLKKASERNQRLTKVNADILEGVRDKMQDIMQKQKNRSTLYRTADLVAQKYGLSNDLSTNIINARKFFHITQGRKPTVNDNLYIRRMAELMTSWRRS